MEPGAGITIPGQLLLWLTISSFGCALSLAVTHTADRHIFKPTWPGMDVLRYVIGDTVILFWAWVFALGSGQTIVGVALTVLLVAGGLVVILLHGLGGVKRGSESARHEGALLAKVDELAETVARLQAGLLGRQE